MLITYFYFRSKQRRTWDHAKSIIPSSDIFETMHPNPGETVARLLWQRYERKSLRIYTGRFYYQQSELKRHRYVTNDRLKFIFSETYCGTLTCAPPEIISGTPYQPKMADMWSFGIVIFTMLNKANPFTERNRKMLLSLQRSKSWKFRSRFERILTPEVKFLVRNLLEPEPNRRLNIDQVLSSDWMSMDPKLRTMTTYEFAALNAAMEEKKAPGVNQATDQDGRCRTFSKWKYSSSMGFLKQIDNQYIKALDRSRQIQSF